MSDEEGLRELLRKAGYSEKAIDHYVKKRNVGVTSEGWQRSFQS